MEYLPELGISALAILGISMIQSNAVLYATITYGALGTLLFILAVFLVIIYDFKGYYNSTSQ